MDADSLATLIATCAPLVHPTTAHALIEVESGFNPDAIGVVRAALDRQPKTLGEALVTARLLRSRDVDFSVGLAQINVRNIDRLGMTLQEAFDPCRNLKAMQTILCDCFDRSRGVSEQVNLRRALSCYYGGNFTVGFLDGYVKRVVSATSLKRPE